MVPMPRIRKLNIEICLLTVKYFQMTSAEVDISVANEHK